LSTKLRSEPDPVFENPKSNADCQLIDPSLPAQLTRFATQLDRHRQPVDHPTKGRLSTRSGRSQ
jgi:hypothetical protein